MNSEKIKWLKRINLALVIIVSLQLVFALIAANDVYKKMAVTVSSVYLISSIFCGVAFVVCAIVIAKKKSGYLPIVLAELVFMASSLILTVCPLLSVVSNMG